MADVLVSALVNPILENLSSLLLKEYGLGRGLKTELRNLESTLTTIQAVLHDAEKKQWKNEAVKNWLRKLKDAAYDAEDVVEEFAIEAQRRGQPRGWRNTVTSFFSIDQKMAHKAKNFRDRLDAIAKERQFHLTVGGGDIEADSSDRRHTWSLVNESEIYGRDQEKEELIESLVNNSGDLSVYVICGMGGIGKTTLARLIYNAGRVKRHFDLTIWICVSDDSTPKRLARAMIESIENSPCDIKELDNLQQCLQKKLSGKKLLLVLDDVWDDFNDEWSSLKVLLRCGAKGSSVLITTRIEMVALKMKPVLSQHMERLSGDDSWRLFESLAFGIRNREEYVNLEAIGRAIVDKCGGVPLAIKSLGSLMSSKTNESEWLSVERSEIWDLQEEGSKILPALRLSYTNLPSHLKQCFAFCCIFPKDHVMGKDQMIALWMANSFIPCKGYMDLHEMGHAIFNELVGRSFLQEVKEDEWGNTTCKMHDLMHDLAQSIMLHECCSVEGNRELEISKPFRHVAVWGKYDAPSDCGKFLNFQSLRSFVLLDRYVMNLSEVLHLCFSRQKHLRALDVGASYDRIKKLPKSICNLKHLRYLDVSWSNIETLPESTSSLQNLQTLNLSYCGSLRMLPKGINRLKNLVYLDITGCNSLRSMPSGMGRLICLRKLNLFIVGENVGQRIRELGSLNNLGGNLSIEDLVNVKDLTDAKSANLMGKTALQSLSLSWHGNEVSGSRSCVIRENIEDVIDGLQPHSNMKKLRIDGYGGSKYPNWMMNLNLMLPNLVEMELIGCGNCEQLPPFGKLQFLKHLYLENMDGVKCIGSDVYGNEENPFPSLEVLSLQSMSNFEKWENVAGRQGFPRLRVLRLQGCPVLIEIPIMPSVKTLDIVNCNAMVCRSVRNLTSLTSLEIISIPHLQLLPDGFLQNHVHLELLKIRCLCHLQSLSNQILDNLSSLKSLIISYCHELESLPEEGLRNLNSLETLSIWRCDGLKSLSTNGLSGLSSLRQLYVGCCAKLASLSEGVRYLTALEDLHLDGCPELNSLPESIQHLTSLRSLTIQGCDRLSSLPNQIGYLTALDNLDLYGCPELNSLPESIQHLTSLRSLKILDCKRLSSLPNQIGYLTSLSLLLIRDCPKLMCLPYTVQSLGMLRELIISGCPDLERRCEKERGETWPKIAHIPYINISDKAIQGSLH